jgi:hypothetical protein
MTRRLRPLRTIRKRCGALAMALLGLVAACNSSTTEPDGHSTIMDVAAGVAQAAAAVTGQKAPLADQYEKGRYVGFDTHTYPGSATMRAWKNAPGAPYSWVGYYLPSPCHADKSWTGKRDSLQAMGWGVAVVYVGQQTWGKTPRALSPAQAAAVRKKNDCNQDLMSAAEGTANADDATAKAAAEGFQKGVVVFLDLERVEKVPQAMKDYYRAWTARMLANGQYLPGIYTHEHNAAEIFADVQNVFKQAGDTTTPRFWIAGGKGFDEGRAPQDVGFAFAGMWQGVIDVARSVANIKLPVDVNVGSWKSPSESGISVQ